MGKGNQEMLIKIEMTGKWAKRVGAKTKRTFEFKPGVNLLVGPNGSGKSSIIAAIRAHVTTKSDREREKLEKEVRLTTNAIKIRVLDFEKDNPRTKGGFMDAIMFQVGSMYHSHGETNRAIIGGLSEDEFKDKLVILDEPDQALDFDGANILLEQIRKCPAAQMLVSIHHPVLVFSEFRAIELEQGYRARVREAMKGLIAKS